MVQKHGWDVFEEYWGVGEGRIGIREGCPGALMHCDVSSLQEHLKYGKMLGLAGSWAHREGS